MPQQLFSHWAPLLVSETEAWAALQDPHTWASIGGVDHVASARTTAEGALSGFRFAATVAGRRYPGTASVAHANAPSEMTVTIATSELDGRIAVQIAPSHTSGRIDVSLIVRSKSLMAGMFFPAIADAIGSGFPQRVEVFAHKLTTP